jgi:hypothetical protein
MERVHLDLKDQHSRLLEEARVILPGQQALFGFQLIAVFNEAFQHRLTEIEQVIHLSAIGLSVIAIGLSMTPAAMHRQAEPHEVSQEMVTVAGRLLAFALLPLMGAIGLDFYLVSRLTLHDERLAAVIAIIGVALLAVLWYGLPAIWNAVHKREEPAKGRKNQRPA